jgi:hypothetical protein
MPTFYGQKDAQIMVHLLSMCKAKIRPIWSPGANPNAFDFTTTTPELCKAGAFFQSRKKYFCFQNETCGAVKIHNAGVANHNRRIGSSIK